MKVRKSHIEGLIALLLFGVFAVCLMMVLLTGAGSYQRLTHRDQEAYDRRTCMQYIATQVRQGDRAGGVSVVPFGEGDAVALEESIEGKPYVTYIYLYQGYLMELFCSASSGLSPEDGTQIMALQGLELSLDRGRLRISCVDETGVKTSLSLSLRSEGGNAQ